MNILWKNKITKKDHTCQCGSWKYHWVRFSGRSWPLTCSIKGCRKRATVGAHIYSKDVDDEKIIPACVECSKLEGEFSLKNHAYLVSADKKLTCEK